MSTLLQIRTRTRDFLREDSEAVFDDADLNNYINDAQAQVATLLHPNYLFTLVDNHSDTTVAGTANYDLPSDFLKVAGNPYIAGIGSFKLVPFQQVQEIKNDLNAFLAGKRISWIQDNDIYFDPTTSFESSAAITFPYLKRPATLSSDGTESDIPQNLIELVVNYAVAIQLSKIEAEQRASFYLNKFYNTINLLNSQIQINLWGK